MKTIDITTTQNVTIEYELASWRERFLAFLLDLVIIAVATSLVTAMANAALGRVLSNYFDYIVIVPLVAFYSLYMEVLMNGQTIGKKVLAIKVIKLNGEQPSLSDYAIRWAMRSIDIVFSVGSVATLLISSSPKSQRLGCLLSGSTVIRLNSTRIFTLRDILRISTLENYQPTYPQITRFSEKDMLFMKSVLERFRRFPNDAHRSAVNELASHVVKQFDLGTSPKDPAGFLRTLINDYIVLTR